MAGGFFAEDFGFGGGVEAGAEVGIYVVYADEGVFDEDFVFCGGGDWEVGLVVEDFCAAGAGDENAAHCFGDLGGGCHCPVVCELFGEL